jgi:serine protease
MSTHPQGSVAYRATATVAAVIAAVFFLLAGAAFAQGPDPDRFIVKFQDGKGPQGKAAVRSAGGELLVELEPQNAAAFRIPAEALAGISRNPNIEYIEVDPPRYPMAQVVPYGITMVQANPAVTDGVPPGTAARPKVCVIDSGYDRGHEDLPSGTGITGFASGSQTWYTDTCGHGTHVAGTIAALNNTKGVIGVMGSGLDLIIAKVFDGANCSTAMPRRWPMPRTSARSWAPTSST